MGRHAGKRVGSPRPPTGRRPGLGLLGWAVFTAALAAAALLWAGIPLSTAGAVPVLVLVAFALVWVAAWRTGRVASRDRPDDAVDTGTDDAADDPTRTGRTDATPGQGARDSPDD